MRILLVEPPAVSEFGNQRIFGGNGSNKSDFRKPPLDLMMISGYLRKSGYDNDILDANASRRNISYVRKFIADGRYDIVFFSTSTCTIHKDMLVAETAKDVNPDTITVAVGTHVMALYDEVLENDFIDIAIVSGEWEEVALNIVKNGKNFSRIKGIAFKDNSGVCVTASQEPVYDLDRLGFPSHDKIERELYHDTITKAFPKTMVMGQKACINNCSFCCQPAFFGAPSVRYRSVGHFLDELEWVHGLGFREVMFNDATFTSDKEWARGVCEGMMERGIGLVWNCSTRADCLDKDIVAVMKKAGCHTVALGMESVDKRVLANIRKNVSPDRVKEAVKLIKRAGMDTIVFCVIGFPGETLESIKKTIDFLSRLDTTFITLGIAVPAPGTDFYRYVESNGYLHTKDWSKYDPMKEPVFSYQGLSKDEILYWSRYGLKKFYLRPQYIVKRIFSIRSFGEFKTNFTNFIGFLKRYL